MKISRPKPFILLLALAVLLTIVGWQRQRLHAARLAHADLLVASSTMNRAPGWTAEIPVSAREREELERLRREKIDLGRLQARRDEMNRKEAAFQATVVPPPPPQVPEGKLTPLQVSLALAEAPAADRSTPLGALHQFIWAAQHGDAPALGRLRTPGTPAEEDDGSDLDPASPLHEVIRHNRAAALLRDQDALDGAASVNPTQQRELPDGRVALTFRLGWETGRGKGHSDGGETLLRRVGGQWFVESLKWKAHEISMSP